MYKNVRFTQPNNIKYWEIVMLRIVAFIITIAGGINWLAIGMLQYDFIAGIFGTQANIFSRIIYTLVGVSAVYITCAIISNKGRLTEGEKKRKKAE